MCLNLYIRLESFLNLPNTANNASILCEVIQFCFPNFRLLIASAASALRLSSLIFCFFRALEISYSSNVWEAWSIHALKSSYPDGTGTSWKVPRFPILMVKGDGTILHKVLHHLSHIYWSWVQRFVGCCIYKRKLYFLPVKSCRYFVFKGKPIL